MRINMSKRAQKSIVISCVERIMSDALIKSLLCIRGLATLGKHRDRSLDENSLGTLHGSSPK